MENLISFEDVEKNEKMLLSTIFTKIQLTILKKKLQKKELTSNEKTYYYTYIKPKIKAMMNFFEISELVIQGKDMMIPEILNDVTKIIRQLEKKHKNQKIMVSGSYLFNKKHNDIDVFIFSKYKKEDYRKGKLHITHLTENSLNSMFFHSISKLSVSNFKFLPTQEFHVDINDFLQNYELIINHQINNEECDKYIRNFILQAEYLTKNNVLNSKELYIIKNKLSRKNYEIISRIFINSLILGYDEGVLLKKINEKIADYKNLQKNYSTAKNIAIYLETYSKVKNLAIASSTKNNTRNT